MNDENTFIAVNAVLAVISIIACIVLNKNRRIPHTASFADDPAGATSDLLIFFSFLFTSITVIFLMFGKMQKVDNCEQSMQKASSSIEKPKDCKNKAP